MLNLFWAFILTKWYVNSHNNAIYVINKHTFILTKWYVNEVISAIATTLVCAFYIN